MDTQRMTSPAEPAHYEQRAASGPHSPALSSVTHHDTISQASSASLATNTNTNTTGASVAGHTEGIKNFKTEYKSKFTPFDQYVYNEVTDSFVRHATHDIGSSASAPPNASSSISASRSEQDFNSSGEMNQPMVSLVGSSTLNSDLFEPAEGHSHQPQSEPWYKEVQKRHEKANELRFKSEVGHSSPYIVVGASNHSRTDSPLYSDRQLLSPAESSALAGDQLGGETAGVDASDAQASSSNSSSVKPQHQIRFTPQDYKRDHMIAHMANNNNFAAPKSEQDGRYANRVHDTSVGGSRPASRSPATLRARSQSSRRQPEAASRVAATKAPASKSNQTTPTRTISTRPATAAARATRSTGAPTGTGHAAPATRTAVASRVAVKSAAITSTSRVTTSAATHAKAPTKSSELATKRAMASTAPSARTHLATTNGRSAAQTNGTTTTTSTAARTATKRPTTVTRVGSSKPAAPAPARPTTIKPSVATRAPSTRPAAAATKTAPQRLSTTANSKSALRAAQPATDKSSSSNVRSIKTPKAAAAAAAVAATTAAAAGVVLASDMSATRPQEEEKTDTTKQEEPQANLDTPSSPTVDDSDRVSTALRESQSRIENPQHESQSPEAGGPLEASRVNDENFDHPAQSVSNLEREVVNNDFQPYVQQYQNFDEEPFSLMPSNNSEPTTADQAGEQKSAKEREKCEDRRVEFDENREDRDEGSREEKEMASEKSATISSGTINGHEMIFGDEEEAKPAGAASDNARKSSNELLLLPDQLVEQFSGFPPLKDQVSDFRHVETKDSENLRASSVSSDDEIMRHENQETNLAQELAMERLEEISKEDLMKEFGAYEPMKVGVDESNRSALEQDRSEVDEEESETKERTPHEQLARSPSYDAAESESSPFPESQGNIISADKAAEDTESNGNVELVQQMNALSIDREDKFERDLVEAPQTADVGPAESQVLDDFGKSTLDRDSQLDESNLTTAYDDQPVETAEHLASQATDGDRLEDAPRNSPSSSSSSSSAGSERDIPSQVAPSEHQAVDVQPTLIEPDSEAILEHNSPAALTEANIIDLESTANRSALEQDSELNSTDLTFKTAQADLSNNLMLLDMSSDSLNQSTGANLTQEKIVDPYENKSVDLDKESGLVHQTVGEGENQEDKSDDSDSEGGKGAKYWDKMSRDSKSDSQGDVNREAHSPDDDDDDDDLEGDLLKLSNHLTNSEDELILDPRGSQSGINNNNNNSSSADPLFVSGSHIKPEAGPAELDLIVDESPVKTGTKMVTTTTTTTSTTITTELGSTIEASKLTAPDAASEPALMGDDASKEPLKNDLGLAGSQSPEPSPATNE